MRKSSILAKPYRHHPILWAVRMTIFLCLSVIVMPYTTAQADTVAPEIPPSYQIVGENDLFQLYVDSATLAFKVLDKRSNYLWHSGIDEPIDGDKLNKSWQAFAKSGISIEYLDENGVNKRISITNATHTLDIVPIEQGISAQVVFQDFGITVGVTLQLEAQGIRVEMPFANIHEDMVGFRLAKIYVYPFLGATRGSSVDGYMLLPDGVGSITRYADTTKAENMFNGRYYGDDLGMIAYEPYDPSVMAPHPISMPIFGAVHGEKQNAFIAIVEKGAAYGEVQMHPAGVITNFNFIYNAFVYNETYFQATNRSGAGVTTIQRRTNAFDTVIHYRFITGDEADYVGMAHDYQQYLVEKGLLHQNTSPNHNIGIRLEFLAGDKERVLLWDRFVSMTTIAQVATILADLNIANPEVIYYGWQPLGASKMPPNHLEIEGALGSLSDLTSLAEDITAKGGQFSLYLDPQVAVWGESGFSTRTDVAMSITNVALEGYGRLYFHYYTLNVLQDRYTELANDIASHLQTGLALDSIGNVLFSDFKEGHQLDREATISAYQALFTESRLPLGFYRPNDYLLGVANAYYDMPLGDNGYIYTSETVPFLPIVLAGYLPYYGTVINFSSNLQDDLLRQIEYGIYPSYFVTQEPTANLINTVSGWIYTSSYEQWGDHIKQTYAWMNALLAPVRGQTIIAHTQLADGVYATTYANGKQIIVNYNDVPFLNSGITVEAHNALLLENGR